MDTVIVSGGTGFVASWVIVKLLEKGYKVKASFRNDSKADALRLGIEKVVGSDVLKNLSFFKADLTSEANWKEAMDGAIAVMHIASPLGNGTEKKEELVKIAKEGTLNILKSAIEAKVPHIIMTSSQAASTPHSSVGSITLDESFWTDITNPELDPYRISKIEAEKVAWEFVKDKNISLTTILPGAVFGPLLSKESNSTNEIIAKIMLGMPGVIKVGMEVSDVRDLAELHILALENEVARGKRYLAADQSITMQEMAQTLKIQFPEFKKIKIRAIPNFIVIIGSKFIPSFRSFVPMLKRRYQHTAKLAETELGWQQHAPKETIIATAESLIKFEIVSLK